jgi:hypothetical protein
MNHCGPGISVEYLSGEPQKLREIQFSNNYYESSFNITGRIEDYLISNTCIAVIGMSNADGKNLSGKITLKKEDLEELMVALKDVKHLAMTDYATKENSDARVFSIVFLEQLPKGEVTTFDIMARPFEYYGYKALQIFFYDDNDNTIFISEGQKYGFYEMKNLNSLKRILVREFKL